MVNEVRYEVITVLQGQPESRQPFRAVDAAARYIAEKHMAGFIVKCHTNALTEILNKQRQADLAKRVNEIIASEGFIGEPWQP